MYGLTTNNSPERKETQMKAIPEQPIDRTSGLVGPRKLEKAKAAKWAWIQKKNWAYAEKHYKAGNYVARIEEIALVRSLKAQENPERYKGRGYQIRIRWLVVGRFWGRTYAPCAYWGITTYMTLITDDGRVQKWVNDRLLSDLPGYDGNPKNLAGLNMHIRHLRFEARFNMGRGEKIKRRMDCTYFKLLDPAKEGIEDDIDFAKVLETETKQEVRLD